MVAQDNGGPPAGSFSDSAFAQQIPASQIQNQLQRELGGGVPVRLDDPAFQPPVDPLIGSTKAQSRLVYRDLPLVTTLTDWTVDQMRGALRAHMWGIFDGSGQLTDAILGDDRVQATLGSRISGLFGRETRFRPANDSIAAKECLDAWVACWPNFATAAAMTEMAAYSILMGFEPAQAVWGPYAGVEYAPQMRPFHPRYTYYNWQLRRLVALTQDGQMPVLPGNGKWILHAPYGEYRGWIRGAVRPVAEPWLIRHWAIRDWARFSEVHGLPIKKAIVPASADEMQRDAYAKALTQLATETTVMVSRGNDGNNGYDLELVEAKDTAWEAFPGLRDHCDMAIVLAIKFQNLTTEIRSGGSLAASKTHENVDDRTTQYENVAWRWTIRQQVARPFAWLNFGDPELAPITDWDVTPRDEYAHNAKQFTEFGRAIQQLSAGGVKFASSDEVRRFAKKSFGLDGLPDFTISDPPSGSSSGGSGFGGGSI